ncbi:hypothetical protein DET65_1862 [Sunxiuqinia elliptica]|uniref:Uncharacterized protein n=1 Tax=Sunxiuqinia elliptica TaxID=655355 RepID=A0A4R6H6N2_9BACT|nr:hypothetical protein DET52_102185 [Sunxiuqinia elliptica]TDO62132.1 hypothetical protein DET65_1862 [Sunxiuqinia elliptica]
MSICYLLGVCQYKKGEAILKRRKNKNIGGEKEGRFQDGESGSLPFGYLNPQIEGLLAS